jgi:glycosyltransferase involved in cell wall biosynthesis
VHEIKREAILIEKLHGPKVSVGVCVRNCEKIIGETIESIMKQDYPHELMEVIFVDDGSSDRTLSIIKDFASKMDMSVKIFYHKWRGVGYSRNVVVKNASGKYIVWVDGDMMVPPAYMSKLVEFMEKHSTVGIAKGRQSLKPGANLLGTLEAYSRAASRMVNYQSEKSMFKSLGTGGSIYRLEALKKIGGFDERIKGYGEDFDAELRIKENGWTFAIIDVYFSDYERFNLTLGELWTRYWLRGYHSSFFLRKNKDAVKLYKMLPFAAAIAGLLDSIKIYRLTNKKSSFLMTFLYLLKTVAWWSGYIHNSFH